MKRGITAALGLILSTGAFANTVHPTSPKDFKQVIVKLTDETKQSGGTGVIYSSSETGSIILTNAHVCEGAKLAITQKGDFVVESRLKSKYHDLCAVKVKADLGVNTEASTDLAEFGDDVTVAGHPFLLPLTVTKGYLSDNVIIQMISEVVPCTEKDMESHPLECLFLGGVPVVKSINTKTISATIAPGNSGSPVWNNDGEIVGFVFAGQGRSISYGIIVPQEYVLSFLANELPNGKFEAISATQKEGPQQQRSEKFHPNTIHNASEIILPSVVNPNYDNLLKTLGDCKGKFDLCLNQLNLL